MLEPEERTMIAGVMRLGDRLVRTIMTPATDVEMIDVNDTPAKIGKQMADSGHSRFIAYDGSKENIIGVLQAKDVAAALLAAPGAQHKKTREAGSGHPETLDALDVVNLLKELDVHFGLVYDEYGKLEGIVTTGIFWNRSSACSATTTSDPNLISMNAPTAPCWFPGHAH